VAIPYSEDWAAGNSYFDTFYRYDKPPETADPLYPFIRASEGVYINGDGRLDKNPAYTGLTQDYTTAGIWFKGMGPLTGGGPGAFSGSGFWTGTIGCIQCTYYPTTDSLNDISDIDENFCPLVAVVTPQLGQTMMGVSVDIDTTDIKVDHSNEGEHDEEVFVTGAPMPVAGQPYTVRLGWQCGTLNESTKIAAPDGFVRVSINGELVYEAVDISLLLNWQTNPGNKIDGVTFGLAGLLGPLDNFTINETECTEVSPIVFYSGRTSSPVAWSKILLKVTE
jgi:hypothetical protein